jgi:hypothetical protein
LKGNLKPPDLAGNRIEGVLKSPQTKRKVKFYSLTRAGLKQLSVEVANWERAMALVARFLEAES